MNTEVTDPINLSVDELKEQFPGVELAYPIALNAYEVALKRLDALDGRVQSLMTFFVTITLAVPAVTVGKGLSYRSPWFITAMILFAVANSFGLLARLKGTIMLPDPKKYHDEFLSLSDWWFKKDTIYWSGQNFQNNNGLVLERSRYLNLMCLFYLTEALALAVWAAQI